MAKIIVRCAKCNKAAEETSRRQITTGLTLVSFNCGHSKLEQNLNSLLLSRIKEWESKNWDGFFLDGTLPRAHQVENWEHYAKSGGRHQIQDDTGLGKTVSALGQIKLHKESVPCLALCKPSLAAQWALEIERKLGIIPQILRGKEQPDTKTFPIVICSLDLLRNTRNTWLKEQEEKKLFKSVIIDEIQLIKNGQAARTNAVRDFCKTVQFMTQLSGTPIENHGGEYFSSLNMLAPTRYHTYEHFLLHEVGQYWDGSRYKIGGLRHPAEFKERNKDILIRHRLEDVKGMPAVQRDFRIVEISERVQKAYDTAEAAFLAAIDEAEYGGGGESKFESARNILAKMQILRHITGIAKLDASIEWISDFLEVSDRKLAVYCHHNDVGEQLILKLNELCKKMGIDPPVSLIGVEASDRQRAMQPFTEGQSRILIAKLLASGEGVDLHMCSDYLVTERHWNPKKEEQVEGRGTRLSSKFSTVFVTYLVGFQTIDEYMALLNEHKRHNVDKSIEGAAEAVSETDLFKKIAELLRKRGKRAWRIA